MARQLFESPFFSGTDSSGKQFTVDVTSSIAPSLDPNSGLIDSVTTWMKEHHYTRILDFGAGALRHTIPLLRTGFEVTAVEYKNAFERPVAAGKRLSAKRFKHFSDLVWPHDFLKSKEKYDVVLLAFVLQTIPEKKERDAILYEIAKRLDRDGPRRLYYASRFGDKLPSDKPHAFKDGWIRKLDQKHQTFYTEWTPAETERFMKRRRFERIGGYSGASQAYIFEHEPRRGL
jgi:hypothetical protein